MGNFNNEAIAILVNEIIKLKNAIYPLRDIEDDECLMKVLMLAEKELTTLPCEIE